MKLPDKREVAIWFAGFCKLQRRSQIGGSRAVPGSRWHAIRITGTSAIYSEWLRHKILSAKGELYECYSPTHRHWGGQA